MDKPRKKSRKEHSNGLSSNGQLKAKLLNTMQIQAEGQKGRQPKRQSQNQNQAQSQRQCQAGLQLHLETNRIKMKCREDTLDDTLSIIHLNNAAAREFYTRSSSAGLFYFKLTLETCQKILAAKGSELTPDIEEKIQRDMEIIQCNFGTVLVLDNKFPICSFQFLAHSRLRFPENPYILLRYAEACVQSTAKMLNADVCTIPKTYKYDIIRDLRKTLNQNMFSDFERRTVREHFPKEGDYPKPDLRTALRGLQYSSRVVKKAMKAGFANFPPTPLIKSQYHLLRLNTSIDLLTAYIALYSKNYPLALEKSKLVLEAERIPDVYKYCAKIYFSLAHMQTESKRGFSSIMHPGPSFNPDPRFPIPATSKPVRDKKTAKKVRAKAKANVNAQGAGALAGPSPTLGRVYEEHDLDAMYKKRIRYPDAWCPGNQQQANLMTHYQQIMALVVAEKFEPAFNLLDKLFSKKSFNPPPAYIKLYLYLAERFELYDKVYRTCTRFSGVLQAHMAQQQSVRNIRRFGFNLVKFDK